jgi:predicted nucleotidyltransferase component of viral defense system
MYNEKKIKKSELFQLILLNGIYSLSGSEQIIFQGGTALRWIYGGMRLSEDLDFLTPLPKSKIETILAQTLKNTANPCIAQFGPGRLETKKKKGRMEALKTFFIYRQDNQRERIAVKVEFEMLHEGYLPDHNPFVLRDIPSVSAMIANGDLVMPYSSSIVITETPEEIFTDKIRAIYERKYLRGRDIYDIWWLSQQFDIQHAWTMVRKKLSITKAKFIPAREANFFQKKRNTIHLINTLEADLPRFIPENIYALYNENGFDVFIQSLKKVTSTLLKQGMEEYFNLI